MYLPSTSPAQLLSDPNLESALREAGHAVRAVTTNADLDSGVRTGVYDADVTDAPDVERAQATAHNAVVLPAVYLFTPAGPQPTKRRTRVDRDKAAQAFNVVVAVPGRPGHYCAAVDKTMELKLRRQTSAGSRRS